MRFTLHVFLLACAACAQQPAPFAPTPIPSASSPSPTPAALPTAPEPPRPSSELTICLAHEPQSLYRYAPPEANREHLLAALEDGPVDVVGGVPQTALLTRLPSVADGDARVALVTVRQGDVVVDDLGRVVTLTEGVTVNLLEGEVVTYDGGAITVPQLTVRFTLRPGLRWSDGAPLTAHDSVFAFEIARSPEAFDARRLAAERTAAYRALDERTVEWTGLPGHVDARFFLNIWPPLPRHRYQGQSAAAIAASDEANRAPLSYGPFALKEWLAGERLILERNPHYVRAAEGRPRLERVTYRFIPAPADTGQWAQALRDHACDLFPSDQGLEQFPNRPALADRAGFELQTADGAVVDYLVFGITPAPDYARPAGNDLLADRRAREAISECVSRIDQIPNPARARALMAELGWDETRPSLQLAFAAEALDDVWRSSVVNQVRMELETNCGLAIELRPLTQGELLGDWPDGVLFGRRFDLALLGVNVTAAPVCAMFMSQEIANESNPGGANVTGYRNPEFDQACRRTRTTLDPVAAFRWQAEAAQRLATDLPAVAIAARPRLAAVRPQVQGYVLDQSSRSELWNLEEIEVMGE